MEEAPFTLCDTERARTDAQRLFDSVSLMLISVLPTPADIRHIGATAVPGCLTKGDLDIVVRIPPENFEQADAVLASRYSRNEGSSRTKDFSAFEAPFSLPPLGIQLVAIDGGFDDFHLFVEALRQSPQLVTDYNTLKRAHENGPMAAYRAAKGAFIERVLALYFSGNRDFEG